MSKKSKFISLDVNGDSEKVNPCDECFGKICPAYHLWGEDKETLCKDVKAARPLIEKGIMEYFIATHFQERFNVSDTKIELLAHNFMHLIFMQIEAGGKHLNCCISEFFPMIGGLAEKLARDTDTHAAYASGEVQMGGLKKGEGKPNGEDIYG